MTKKAVSLDLHKKKQPIKRGNKRRKLRAFVRNFLDYMKSDTYMFSPLISPQSAAATTFSPASLGEGFGEPIKKQEKYLEFDCYMYAPMVLVSAVETPRAPTGVRLPPRKDNPSLCGNLTEQSSEKPMLDIGNRMDRLREIVRDDCDTATRRIAVKRTLATKDPVKHVVHQNGRPTSIPVMQSSPIRDWHSSRMGGRKKGKRSLGRN